MRKLIITLILILSLAAMTAFAAGGAYVASRLREPFHFPACKWAQKIDPENLVWYSSREAAIADGHRPCKVCKP